MKNMKKNILITGFILLVIFLVLSFFTKEKTITVKNFVPVPGYSENNKIILNGDILTFTNDRYLVDYDVRTGISKKISNTSKLQGLSGILASPDNKNLLFKATSIEPEGTVSDEEQPTWWIAGQNNPQPRRSNSFNENVQWVDQETYVTADNSVLEILNINDSSRKTVYRNSDDKPITSLKAINNNIYFTTAGYELFKYSLSGNNTIKINEKVLSATYSNKEGCFILYQGNEGSENVTISISGCGKKGKVLEGVAHQPIFNDAGDKLVYFRTDKESTAQPYLIDLKNNKEKRISFDKIETSDVEIISFKNEKEMMIRAGGSYYMTNAYTYNKITSAKSYEINRLKMDINPDTQTVTTSKDGEITDEDKDTVYKNIQKQGYNIDLLFFNFIKIKSNDRWN